MSSLTNMFAERIEPFVWPLRGTFGLGNSNPKTPFKKVIYGTSLFEDMLERFDFGAANYEEILIDSLLKMASDRDACFPDAQMSFQLLGKAEDSACRQEDLRGLCSLFVRRPEANYGTRTQSVLLVSNDDQVTYFEKTLTQKILPLNTDDEVWSMSKMSFKIHQS